jgi:hypothetical protein
MRVASSRTGFVTGRGTCPILRTAMTKTWLTAVFVGLPVAVAACAQLIGIEDLPPLPDTGDAGLGNDAGTDSDGDGIPDDREAELGTNPNNPDTDGDGFTDGEEVDIIGTNPADPGCENQSAEASQSKLPADIIIAIDLSSSMGEEADAVEENINNDLAGILEAGEVDYRIILLADFPPTEAGGDVDPSDPTVCIEPPPGGGVTLQDNNCANLGTQRKPNNFTAGTTDLANQRFAHYDVHVESHDALRVLLNEFDDAAGDLGTTAGSGATLAQFPGGYGQLLREDAIRIFIIITDDESTGITLADFDTQFTAKLSAKFVGGTPELRYIAHSILGMVGKPDGTAWLPEEGVQNMQCTPGSEDPGLTYQNLSILTGGLRFPLCQVNDADPNNDDFNLIFNAIAENVKTETNLPCSFTPPPRAPDEPPLNYQGAKLIYRPGDTGQLELLEEVDDASMCGTTDNAFYKVGSDQAPESFELCPAACDRVDADLSGKINLIIDCEIQVG